MKVIGVGLNKTGTKTLKHILENWELRHQSYDLTAFNLYREGKVEQLLDWMEDYDSFEDWPWPLMYREIDARFPDTVFVLTTRSSPDRWYKSLCKMAVRMGPLSDFEEHIYGYRMPHGHKQEHVEFYERHNREVAEYFRDRPGKLIEICWEQGDDVSELANAIGRTAPTEKMPHVNESVPVYSGDNLWAAHANRIVFQTRRKIVRLWKRLYRRTARLMPSKQT